MLVISCIDMMLGVGVVLVFFWGVVLLRYNVDSVLMLSCVGVGLVLL